MKNMVRNYKKIFQSVLNKRPSGTRQKLASELGKNRSFISQISNPDYSVPIPPRHLESIFEICRFTKKNKTEFLKAYAQAHPNRINTRSGRSATREITLQVPDLGSSVNNKELEELIMLVSNKISRIVK